MTLTSRDLEDLLAAEFDRLAQQHKARTHADFQQEIKYTMSLPDDELDKYTLNARNTRRRRRARSKIARPRE